MEKVKYKLIGIIIFALALRLVWIFAVSPEEVVSDPLTYHQAAVGLLEDKKYNPGGLFAYMPPLYPLFLAFVYKIFGVNIIYAKCAQALLGALSCGVFFLLIRQLTDKRSGLYGAFLYAVYPQLIRYTGELWSETLFLFLFLSALYFLYKSFDGGLWRAVAAGLLMGLSALTREIALLFLVPMAFWILLFVPHPKVKNFMGKFIPVVAAMMLVITPWIIRNYMHFKKFIPISTNSGVNLYIGNNPQANGEFKWAIAEGARWPDSSVAETDEEIKKLELEVGDLGKAQALAFVKNHPMQFARLAIKKMYMFWVPPYFNMRWDSLSAENVFRIGWVLFYTLIILVALPGMVISLRQEGAKFLLLHLWLLMLTAIAMVTYYSPRYRLPFIPALMIFAIYGGNFLFKKYLVKK